MASCKFKNTLEKVALNVGVFFIYILMWLIFLTCKKSYTPNSLPQNGCVVVFWHGRLSFMSFAYRRWWSEQNRKQGKVIISDHKDGELITRIIKFFGIGTIRGSSSKGGARALIEALREIKQGHDVIITPDGPRGPRHSVADGAAVIAQKSSCEIYALNFEANSFWEFKSWDKMILPKPFSTINFSLSAPFSVANLEQKEAKEKIQNELWQASQNDGGKSVLQNKEDFRSNLKIWWKKYAHKNKISIFIAIFIVALFGLFFYSDNSYKLALEAKFYYESKEYEKAINLSQKALDLDAYNKMAATTLNQSKAAMKFSSYIKNGKEYLDRIKKMSQNGVSKADNERIKMMCDVMIEDFESLRNSALLDEELKSEALKMKEAFAKLKNELF